MRASPSSTSSQASHSSSTSHRLVFPDECAGSSDRAGPSISLGAPEDDRMSITASGDELGSGEDDSAALPPSGRVALPESDPELTAMLSRAAKSIGLHYRLKPPSPERSRLDDWFLGAHPGFSVGFTTKSRDGHGATARTGSHSPCLAAAPSAHGRTLLFFGQEFP